MADDGNPQDPHSKPILRTKMVTVMYRHGWIAYPVNVRVKWQCPVCGGPRGDPHPYSFYEDGDTYTVDRWDNPCGHVDKYMDVINEAGYVPRGGKPDDSGKGFI